MHGKHLSANESVHKKGRIVTFTDDDCVTKNKVVRACTYMYVDMLDW